MDWTVLDASPDAWGYATHGQGEYICQTLSTRNLLFGANSDTMCPIADALISNRCTTTVNLYFSK